MKLKIEIIQRKISNFTYKKTGKSYEIETRRFRYEPYVLFKARHALTLKVTKFLIANDIVK